MQNRHHKTNPKIALIREAVRREMEAKGHAQKDVLMATGLSQSQLSRFLNGQGKRLTGRVAALCKYAKLDAEVHSDHSDAEYQLSQALRQAIGNNTEAARAVTRVVTALAPILQYLPSEHTPIENSRRDAQRTR